VGYAGVFAINRVEGHIQPGPKDRVGHWV